MIIIVMTKHKNGRYRQYMKFICNIGHRPKIQYITMTIHEHNGDQIMTKS